MFFKIYKTDLDDIDYTQREEIKLLIPLTILSVAQEVYGRENETKFEMSISSIWELITKGQVTLTSAQQKALMQLFILYDQDLFTGASFKSLIEIDMISYREDDNYIAIETQDLYLVFKDGKFGNIAMELAILFRIHSHFNGGIIYKNEREMINYLAHDYNGEFDERNSYTWFLKYGRDYIKDVPNGLIAYPTVDNILVKRHDRDPKTLPTPFIAKPNFNKYIKILEDKGLICKVTTTYGVYGNKVVFCRVAHKRIVEALYKRIDNQKTYAKANDTE